ncbi:hypothetical protein MIR68_004049 [Amoeboaphelidium protococcarum]|nr:hypothetical protein MIR68_004049 [Amoeboaphelidium protococcarum]
MSEQELRRSLRLREIPRVDYNEHRLAKQQMELQRVYHNQPLTTNRHIIQSQQEKQKEPVCDKQESSKVNDEKIIGTQKSDAVLEPLVPVKQEKQQRDAPLQKRRKSRKKKGKSERHQVWAAYDRMFPRLPENKREQIYDWSFEKRSGRIGNVQHIPLEQRVLIAVRTHALYNMTDFQERYENEKDALYEETVGRAEYTGFRDEAYISSTLEKKSCMKTLKISVIAKLTKQQQNGVDNVDIMQQYSSQVEFRMNVIKKQQQ